MFRKSSIVTGVLAFGLSVGLVRAAVTAPPGATSIQEPNPIGGTSGTSAISSMVDQMVRDLALTADQKTQIQAAYDAQGAKWVAIQADNTLDWAKKFEQRQALQTATQTAVDAVLTPDQKAKREALQIQRQAQALTNMTIRQYSAAVTLTDDQKARIQAAYTNQATQQVALSKEPRPADWLQKSQSLVADTRAAVEQVLTPDQRQKLDDYRVQQIAPWRLMQILRSLGPVTITEDQKTKIQALVVDAVKQEMALQQDKTLTGADRAAKTRKIEADLQAKVNGVLTPDQQKIAADYQESQAATVDANMLMSRLFGLGVTADVRTKANAIAQDAGRKMAQVNADATLSAADKTAQTTAITNAAFDQIKQLLTPDQVQKLQKNIDSANTRGGAMQNYAGGSGLFSNGIAFTGDRD